MRNGSVRVSKSGSGVLLQPRAWMRGRRKTGARGFKLLNRIGNVSLLDDTNAALK
jgi:hypothetical protein